MTTPAVTTLPALVSPQQMQQALPALLPNVEAAGPVAAAVTAAVRRYCGWHIAPAVDQTWVMDCDGAQELLLPTLNLAAVTSVQTQEPWPWGPSDWSDDISSTVQWSRAGMLRHPNRWPDGYQVVQVAGHHGWALDDVPDLLVACVGIARESLSNPSGHSMFSRTIGPASESWTNNPVKVGPGQTPANLLSSLEPFRLGVRP